MKRITILITLLATLATLPIVGMQRIAARSAAQRIAALKAAQTKYPGPITNATPRITAQEYHTSIASQGMWQNFNYKANKYIKTNIISPIIKKNIVSFFDEFNNPTIISLMKLLSVHSYSNKFMNRAAAECAAEYIKQNPEWTINQLLELFKQDNDEMIKSFFKLLTNNACEAIFKQFITEHFDRLFELRNILLPFCAYESIF